MPYPQSRSTSPHWSVSSSQSIGSEPMETQFGGRSLSPHVADASSSDNFYANQEQSRPSSRDGSRASSRTRPVIPPRDIPLSALSDNPDQVNRVKEHRVKRMVGPEKDHREWTRSSAFTLKQGHREPYDLGPLLNGDIVHELWFESGDTLVYLFPKNAQKGPSFRIHSDLLVASPSLTLLLRGDHSYDLRPNERRSFDISAFSNQIESFGLGNDDNIRPRTAVVKDLYVLYLPIRFAGEVHGCSQSLHNYDIELLIAYRNLIAFLKDVPLVGTMNNNTRFKFLGEIPKLLERHGFTESKGLSYGQAATRSFEYICDRVKLSDVRESREKTLEAIILAEQMKSPLLYNEAFTHAVGKLNSIKSMKSDLWNRITPTTRNRLERAHHDLERKLITIRTRLINFEFPSVFVGIANSSTATQYKMVDFKAWKSSFAAVRKFTITFYRDKYDGWPPRPDSKASYDFWESGLSRLVLMEIYQNFADLYDALVDRTALTPRGDVDPLPLKPGDNPLLHALRLMMAEFDRHSPPVVPPMPFDLPKLPSHSGLRRGPQSIETSLTKAQVNEILLNSYNRADIKPTKFISDFLTFEREEGRGKSTKELIDNRFGQWLFLYVILQTLPIVTVDVEGLSFTTNVPYFLCERAPSAFPWVNKQETTPHSWYNSVSRTYVPLPTGAHDNSIDKIYQRSHCWKQTRIWANETNIPSPIVNRHIPPPRNSFLDRDKHLLNVHDISFDHTLNDEAPTLDFPFFEAQLSNSGLPPPTLMKSPPRPIESAPQQQQQQYSRYEPHRIRQVRTQSPGPCPQLPPPDVPYRHVDHAISDPAIHHMISRPGNSRNISSSTVPVRTYHETRSASAGGNEGQTFDSILGKMTNQNDDIKEEKRGRGKLRKSIIGI